MSHRRNVLFAALAGAAVIVAAAFAAATPVTPSPGATVTAAHPRFSWTLPAGEQSQGIFIADRRDTSPEGRFYDQSIVQTGVLAPSARAWTASRPLVRVRLLRGRRVVRKAGQRAYSSIGSVGSTSFTWNRQGRIRKGTRLRLLASISSSGVKRTRALVVRAP